MSVATIFLCILLLPQLALVELLDFTKNPDALMEWFLSGTLLIAAVLLLRWLLKDKVSCRVRYALWAVVLVRLLLPLQFDLPVTVSSAQLAPEPPAFLEHPAFTYKSPPAVPAYPEREPELPPLLPTPEPEPESVPGYDLHIVQVEDVILGLWLGGMLLIGGILIFSNAWFDLRQIKRRKLLEVSTSPIPVYILEGIPSPFLFGPFRPAVYLTPEHAADERKLRHILAHELTHYAHKDHIWAVLRCLCLAIHWFNPLVWIAVRLSKRDCELACDEGAVKRLGESERIAYGRTLVDMVAQNGRGSLLSCSTTMTGGKKTIQHRIDRLGNHPETKKTALFLAVSLLTVAAVFTFAGDEPTAKELGIPTSSEAYLRFTEQLRTDLPLSFDRVSEPYDSYLPATGATGARWIKEFLAKCHDPLTDPINAIDADEVPSGTHSLYLYYDYGEGTFGDRYYFIPRGELWYICLEDWDWEEHRWFIPVATLDQGDISDLERVIKNQKSGDSAYWQDKETGYDFLMSMIHNAYAMALHDSQSWLYISKTSETYADAMEQAVALILREASPITEPMADFLTVQMLRLEFYDRFAALHQGEPNFTFYLHPHEGIYYLALAHDEVYTPVATLSVADVNQLASLFRGQTSQQHEFHGFMGELEDLYRITVLPSVTDSNHSVITIQDESNFVKVRQIMEEHCTVLDAPSQIVHESIPIKRTIFFDIGHAASALEPEYEISATKDFQYILYHITEGNYIPVAAVSDTAVEALALLGEPAAETEPAPGEDAAARFHADLDTLFHVTVYDDSVDVNTYAMFLTVTEQEELNDVKLLLAASCTPWEEGTEIPQTFSSNYILLDTDGSTSPAPEYMIETYDSGSFLYRTGERSTPIASIPAETVTELRKLADPDQNPRVVMGISILGSGNTQYEVSDPATIAQLAQLLVSDPDTVARNQHPSYDMTDWLTNRTTRIFVEYGVKIWSREHTEGWYLRAMADSSSFYCVDIPEHLVEDVKAICTRLENYLTCDIPFNYAQSVHYAPSANSNIFISEISRETVLAIDELLGDAALADGTQTLSLMDVDGILDFRLYTESEKLFFFLQEDGERCLASAVRDSGLGTVEHPVTHILPAGTAKILQDMMYDLFAEQLRADPEIEYTVEAPALITQLSELFLNDPETVVLNESPDYDMADWLTNWTNSYVISYGIPFWDIHAEEGWYARAIDSGSWYSIRIPNHLVDAVLDICEQSN